MIGTASRLKETTEFILRVKSNGGTVIAPAKLDALVRYLKAQGIYSNLVICASSSFGSKVSSGKVQTAYNLKNNFDFNWGGASAALDNEYYDIERYNWTSWKSSSTAQRLVSPDATVPNSSNTYTTCFWAKSVAGTTGGETVCCINTSSSNRLLFRRNSGGSSQMQIQYSSNGASTYINAGGAIWLNNVWSFFAITVNFTNGAYTVYRNGTAVWGGTLTGGNLALPTTSSSKIINTSGASGGLATGGGIDYVYFFDTTLTQPQIQKLMELSR